MSEIRASSWRAWFADYRIVLGADRRRLPVVALLMLLAAALDLLGIGLVAPFVLLLLAQPGDAVASAGNWQLAALVGLALIVVFALKAWVAYRVQRRITAVSEAVRATVIERLMWSYQARPWSFHLERGSAELVQQMLWQTQTYSGGTMASSLRLATDSLLLVALIALLGWRTPLGVLVLGGALALLGLALAQRLRRRLHRIGEVQATLSTGIIEGLQHGLGAFREIRLLGHEAHFAARVAADAVRLGEATADLSALNTLPRHSVEVTVIACLIAMSLLGLAVGVPSEQLIADLGVLAVAGVRLMPAATSVLASLNSIRASRHALATLAQELSSAPAEPRTTSPVAIPARFARIALRGVSFTYPGSERAALDCIDLEIRRGETVGLMGPSGAGKSTLADVLLGFLAPDRGHLELDGVPIGADLSRWQSLAAYIPQNTYLIDASIRANILLGARVDAIDEAELVRAVQLAQLGDLVRELPRGLDTVVGERGVRLSGGQRQRVALARALYHRREFLLLDEATSALDAETEAEIVRAIAGLHGERTLLIIAHRESTLVHADRILRLERGRLAEYGGSTHTEANAGA
jgi:ABC-type multidrug transport system fused ATPase/permease subunit